MVAIIAVMLANWLWLPTCGSEKLLAESSIYTMVQSLWVLHEPFQKIGGRLYIVLRIVPVHIVPVHIVPVHIVPVHINCACTQWLVYKLLIIARGMQTMQRGIQPPLAFYRFVVMHGW